ncbi:MAG: SDR family NAD(P)-dependent oxidoreductase [Chloroflexi bacterium]|nr:MAG: SDR family NAD(P)-dependent oxidoreductase [Chloroflexota bacterium]
MIGQDGVYLITGGLGGLGLQVARWLVQEGARSLVLVGRKAPGEAEQATITELAEIGAQVLVVAADIAEAIEVDKVLATVGTLGRPLRGIVHCAGILDDGMLAQQQWEQFLRVLRPKVAGAWHLHTKTLTQALDFFILFSSAASLIGAPGQCAYASANAFLDTLACHRRARGLPGLSINWGAWTQVGLAAAEKVRGERLAQRGMAGIAPEQGIAILQWLITNLSSYAQIGVLPLDLQQWRHFYPKAANLPLFADFEQQQEIVHPVSRQATLLEELHTAPQGERVELVSTYIRARLAQLLSIDVARIGTQIPLSSLGVDSLIGLELRNSLEDQLNLVLPEMLIWKYPTVTALTELVLISIPSSGSGKDIGSPRLPVGEVDTPNPNESGGNTLSKLPSVAERAVQPSATKAPSALSLPATTTERLSAREATHLDKWIIRFQPRPQADQRLFCFSYAGGGAALYRTWSKDLPEHIELCAIQLPGREGRLSETPITRLSLLVATLAEVLQPLMDRPFAFFGHSMGALIAFELARQLRTSYSLSPMHLFVSGRRAPQILRPKMVLSNLSDTELVQYLQERYHGIPQAILREPEALQPLLAVLRADFALVETATYTSAAPLTCPITALGGEEDESVKPEELLAWCEQTTSAFHLEMFSGDHFYLRQVQSALTQLLGRVLTAVCQQRR